MASVQKQADQLPVHGGDWTDYWNFGSGSSAKETKLNRHNEARYEGSRTVECVSKGDRCLMTLNLKQAFEGIHLYDEHTWGAIQLGDAA